MTIRFTQFNNSLDGFRRQCSSTTDEPTRRLAELERDFLSLLDGFGASPKTLIRFLSEDPEFFAKLIDLYFAQRTSWSPMPNQPRSSSERQAIGIVC